MAADPSSCPYSPSCSELDFSQLRAEGVGYARQHPPLKEVIEMRTLPEEMIRALAPFAPLFSKRVWQHVQVLVVGAFPQLPDAEPLARLCARWAWIKRRDSTPTIGCLAALAGRLWRRVGCC
jgi:hypothetical protein